MVPQSEITAGLKQVAAVYGKPMAIKIERLYRNETRHFVSDNFLRTLSPGMEVAEDAAEIQPYGWTSLKDFWTKFPQYAPIGVVKQVENTSGLMKSRGERRFIKFPSVTASMMSVAYRISSMGGSPGIWFSTIKAKQKEYEAVLLQIIPRYCNQIFQ